MAVVIRLMRTGKRGERKFRIIVKEKRRRRDGKAIEILGWYEKAANGTKKHFDKERVTYWISQGAKPSPTVEKIFNS